MPDPEDYLTPEELTELRRLRDKVARIAAARVHRASDLARKPPGFPREAHTYCYTEPAAIALDADVVRLAGDETGSYGFHATHEVAWDLGDFLLAPEDWEARLRAAWEAARAAAVEQERREIEDDRRRRRAEYERLRREFEGGADDGT